MKIFSPSIYHSTRSLKGMSIAVCISALLVNAHAADSNSVAEKPVFNGEFFQDAPHWQAAAQTAAK